MIKKRRFGVKIPNVPSDTMLGVGILAGMTVIIALAIVSKKREQESSIGEDAQPAQVVKVIDGDTIELNSEKIRLYGIDAPEKGQPCKKNNAPYDCGNASKEHLKFLLTGLKVNCEKKDKDKWGRHVAVCSADGEDISRLMVRHGWAIAYKEYSTAYIEDQNFAELNKLGMWSKEFLIPSEWRKSDRGNE